MNKSSHNKSKVGWVELNDIPGIEKIVERALELFPVKRPYAKTQQKRMEFIARVLNGERIVIYT